MNRSYYQQREVEERSRAESTEDSIARRVHLELADRYAALTTPPKATA